MPLPGPYCGSLLSTTRRIHLKPTRLSIPWTINESAKSLDQTLSTRWGWVDSARYGAHRMVSTHSLRELKALRPHPSVQNEARVFTRASMLIPNCCENEARDKMLG